MKPHASHAQDSSCTAANNNKPYLHRKRTSQNKHTIDLNYNSSNSIINNNSSNYASNTTTSNNNSNTTNTTNNRSRPPQTQQTTYLKNASITWHMRCQDICGPHSSS